ncbi:MAG: OOP family OmpA-OmpF porin [Saprospiraceae bacterium]|jgi:OOP family OmpA-OmpF porin
MRAVLFLLCFSFAGLNLSAQETNIPATTENTKPNSNALAAKLLFLDYGMTNAELEETKISSGLEITYLRNLNNWINIAVPAKLGLTTFAGDLNKTTVASIDAILQIQYYNGKNRLVPYVFGGGGIVSENFSKSNFQVPFGFGLNFELGKNSYINVQAEFRKSMEVARDNMQYGVGYMFRLGNAQVEEKAKEEKKVKEAIIKDRDNDGTPDKTDECPDDFGDTNFFGCPDTDKDGVPDSDDDCPNQAGTLDALGCPDADKDGIPDSDDDCPNAAGPIKDLGCPDSDGDGLADNDDACPQKAGKKKDNGCPQEVEVPVIAEIDFEADDEADKIEEVKVEEPKRTNYATPKIERTSAPDTDNDGVTDDEDACPNEPGSKNSKGCPDSDGDGFTDDIDDCPLAKGEFKGCPDTDKDGVNDANDNCPNESGLVSNGGCPSKDVVADEDLAVFMTAAREVRFETGSDVLESSSYAVLEQVKEVMQRYPNFRLMIEGYTDDIGVARENQILSENRAKACYMYLLANNIPVLNIQYIGFGEMRPLSDNKSKRGRESNRRVEFRMEMK